MIYFNYIYFIQWLRHMKFLYGIFTKYLSINLFWNGKDYSHCWPCCSPRKCILPYERYIGFSYCSTYRCLSRRSLWRLEIIKRQEVCQCWLGLVQTHRLQRKLLNDLGFLWRSRIDIYPRFQLIHGHHQWRIRIDLPRSHHPTQEERKLIYPHWACYQWRCWLENQGCP